jgi:hypothetical protein
MQPRGPQGAVQAEKDQALGGFMNVFSKVVAGFAALLVTVTAFELPDLGATNAPVSAVSSVAYQGISHVAHSVLVAAIAKVEVR